jgi:hypothetical protein
VKLDGSPVNGKTPFALTNLTPGKHAVLVELPGFQPQTLEGVVEAGKTTRLDFKLVAAEAVARFTSEPPGAKVTLVGDGGTREVVGQAPADWKLDPGHKYEVVFEKDGYVTVNRPIDPAAELAASGTGELVIAVVLERAQIASAPGKREPSRPPAAKDPVVAKDPIPKDVPVPAKDPVVKDPVVMDPAPVAAGVGTLMLGAKPQCKIYIDGKDTGLVTPQRSMEVKSGTRRVTFVNNEFNIKETFAVDVKPGQTEKVIKDFSDRIPQ